jgi:glycosyltransferase involved in cell wall biosynthesis
VRILSITAGAAGMYCGSCLRDNALAAELLAREHEVTLLPLYTPTLTDEPNVSSARVLFGGINVYLQQHWSFFRRRIPFLDGILDRPGVINAFARRSVSTDPRLLGDMTVSMLEGKDGVLRREFDKLVAWLGAEPRPDVVNLPNSLLIGLAAPVAAALNRPVCCTLQGEELFLEGLPSPYRERATTLIRQQVREVDRFIAVSDFCARKMAAMLGIPPDRMSIVPLGINMKAYDNGSRSPGPRPAADEFRVGYFARLAPEKGLHLLADAYQRFRRRTPEARARLDAAGYLAPADEPYLARIRQSFEATALSSEFTYHGALELEDKLKFLRGLDVLSVPATYDEPKGLFLLEAMACGVPVLQPRRGAFVEVIERTGGGLLVDPDNAESLATGLETMFRDRSTRERLGRQAFDGVRAHYSIQHSADRLLSVYQQLTSGRHAA